MIDTATNTVITSITVGDGPARVAFSPHGTIVYVTNYLDGTVLVISLT